MVNDEDNLKDVHKLIDHTVRNNLTRHETLTHHSLFSKLVQRYHQFFGIIIISVIILLCCRPKKIEQLVLLLSISKVTNVFQISELDDEWDYELILLLVCGLLYYYSCG